MTGNEAMRYAVLLLLLVVLAAPAAAQTPLKSICRVKGQEDNTLQGLGIVVGLNGTGDGGNYLPTIRSLAMTMQAMGSPLGRGGPAELRDAKNVALVMVTATVPATGALQGDRIDCTVSSIGAAKSLAGGRLLMTFLSGPEDPQNPRVYATAEGPVTLDDPDTPTNARIHRGCRLEESFFTPFVHEGRITLVLRDHYADFAVAQDVAEVINSQLSFQTEGEELARAQSANAVEVAVPPQYLDHPVLFVSQVLALPLVEVQTGPRVVINERAGSVVISGEVQIGPVVVTHQNLVIEAGGNAAAAARFVPLDSQEPPAATLQSLVEALNALHVPTEDVIEIIKGLERNGKLHAQLIIQ